MANKKNQKKEPRNIYKEILIVVVGLIVVGVAAPLIIFIGAIVHLFVSGDATMSVGDQSDIPQVQESTGFKGPTTPPSVKGPYTPPPSTTPRN